MATDIDERASVEERYLAAQSTSDLTVTTERRTSADYIIAAGASHTPLSAVLTGLRSEWDRLPKVPKKSEAEITERALALKDKKGEPDVRRARIEALVWYERQLREQARTLRHRAGVLELLAPWVAAKGIDPALTWLAVYHWLNPNCVACDGLGKRRIPGTPILGPRCGHCEGTGKWPEPMGTYQIRSYIADSVHNASKNQRHSIHSGKVREMKRLAEDGDNPLRST